MLATEQIAVRLPRVLLDALVTGGIYDSRAAAVRAGVEAITALERGQQTDRAIVAGYRHTPPTSREHGSATASRRSTCSAADRLAVGTATGALPSGSASCNRSMNASASARVNFPAAWRWVNPIGPRTSRKSV
ncbi:MAG: hypothetical protein ACYCV5_09350 [Acidimicrobiales bacterium]